MFSDIMFDINVRYDMKNILMMLGMCLTVLFGYNMTNPVTDTNTHAVREVKVQAGDTMWDIAARTAHKDMDVREMVYAMKELNNISDSGTLVPGTVLKVPAHKSNSPVRALDYVAQN
ncbi:LysM domain protein [Veillonella dispar ATCC 17748]|uniref:LysM domain protein n=2 Tax=Veillonellaceae TaxID=31977 RepID=C4FQT7_9FIRM|nr:LysM domain protein [Veillonella dispar ATCC 17748]